MHTNNNNNNNRKNHTSSNASNEGEADSNLPPHLRSRGRISSLNEFRQRVEGISGYNSAAAAPSSPKSFQEELPEPFVDPSLPPPYIPDSAGTPVADYHCHSVVDINSNSPFAQMRREAQSSSKRRRSGLRWHYLQSQGPLISFLLLLAAIAGPLNFGIKAAFTFLLSLRRDLVGWGTTSSPTVLQQSGVGFLIWTSYSIVLLIAAYGWTSISPAATGSGLPQMKTVLTGVDPGFYLPGFFRIRTFVAKVGGIILAVGSGLLIGTEGAFVHIMGITATHLMRLKRFRHFSQQTPARLQILAAACAVGVSTNFSSPVGGVLFSIEVTASYYMISNYWKAFVSSVGAAIMVVLTEFCINQTTIKGQDIAPFATDFPQTPFHLWEIPLYITLGCVMGVAGGSVVWLVEKVAIGRKGRYRNLVSSKSVQNVLYWLDPIVIAILTSTLSWWPGDMFNQSVTSTITQLFSNSDLPVNIWESQLPKVVTLLVYFFSHIILLPLSMSLSIPCGTWIPMFSGGAALGRAAGILIQSVFPSAGINPGTYALVGAASLTGSVTQTVSAAVIALEVTGQLRMLLPVVASVLFGIAISKVIGKSVYEALLVARGLPYLPLLDFGNNDTVKNVMDKNVMYVTRRSSVVQLLVAVNRFPGQDIPIVHSTKTMLLLGTIHASQLKELCRRFYIANGIQGFEADVGEEDYSTARSGDSKPGGFTWHSLKAIITKGSSSNVDNMVVTFDRLHHAGTSQSIGRNEESIPFMKDPEKLQLMLTESWSSEKREVLSKQLVSCGDNNNNNIKPIPMTISPATLLEDAHVIFTMLRCDHCYITERGRLIGVLTTKHMLDSIQQHHEE